MANQLLAGKRGIITGALDESSIAWKVAQKCKEQGATFTLTNAPVAMRMGAINKLAEECATKVFPADATSVEDLEKLYTESMEYLGGKIDFVLHSIGMSPNVRKGKPYTDLNYDFYGKTLDISAGSFHKMMQTAHKLDAVNRGGSFVGLTYIASQRIFPDYGDMADAKSMLESIARGWGYHYGKSHKVRVNTISQSPTKTTAGSGVGGFDAFYSYADEMSPLGNASSDACADYCVFMFSDLSRMITMQNLYHDGGFSNMGIAPQIVEKFTTQQ